MQLIVPGAVGLKKDLITSLPNSSPDNSCGQGHCREQHVTSVPWPKACSSMLLITRCIFPGKGNASGTVHHTLCQQMQWERDGTWGLDSYSIHAERV